MSEAEEKFRAVVKQALIDAVVYKDPKWGASYSDALDSYTDAIVGSLKLDDWLVVGKVIHEVTDRSWEDLYDTTAYWWVWTKMEEEDE